MYSAAMLKSFRHALPLLTPLSLVVAWYFASRAPIDSALVDYWMFWPIVVMYGLLTVVDYACGTSIQQPSLEVDEPMVKLWPLLTLPVQFGLIALGLYMLQTLTLSTLGVTGLCVSVGLLTGILGITTAHELIHKSSKLETTVGGFLLSTVCYASFKVEHIYGHHVTVSTPQDASSARLWQNVYAFVPQAIVRNFYNAWRLAHLQAKRRGHSLWQSELVGWSLCSLVLLLICYAVAGWLGAVFFLSQSLVAIAELEVINYIEHYGLRRKQDADGKYERVRPVHSWNSSYWFTNLLLFQLQRHSDHHAIASRRYSQLQHHQSAPQLPGGYGAMTLLALIPPLWFRIIHPRLPHETTT
jgi:alkane 1-monooxygenase